MVYTRRFFSKSGSGKPVPQITELEQPDPVARVLGNSMSLYPTYDAVVEEPHLIMQRRKSGSFGSFSSLAIVSSSTTILMKYATIQNIVAFLLIFMFLFTTIAFALVRFGKRYGCLPAPYLYVSSTDQQNIMSITRDGCPVASKVLWAPELHNQALNMRSMRIGQYFNKSVLYVANAGSDESSVLIFKNCSYWYNDMRPFLSKTLTTASSSYFHTSAQHAYGLAFDKHGNIYASFEKSNAILRASKDTFLPLPLPAYPFIRYKPYSPPQPPSSSPTLAKPPLAAAQSLRSAATPRGIQDTPKSTHRTYYSSSFPNRASASSSPFPSAISPSHKNKSAPPNPPLVSTPIGTFILFQDPYDENNSTEIGFGVRSIVWAGDFLWIANELDDAVFIVNANGYLVQTIPVKSPIGLHYFETDRSVLVSSKGKKSGGVFAFDEVSFTLTRSFLLMSMHHPVGMAMYEDTLFVADQYINGILAFKISTGRFLKTIMTVDGKANGYLEHLMLSPC